jgi:hypothetical protein
MGFRRSLVRIHPTAYQLLDCSLAAFDGWLELQADPQTQPLD